MHTKSRWNGNLWSAAAESAQRMATPLWLCALLQARGSVWFCGKPKRCRWQRTPKRENYVAAAGGDGVSSTTTWEQSPWQPCVAASWTSLQVKRRFAIKLGKMLQNEPSSALDSEVPYLKAQHVQWNGIRLNELPTMWASAGDIAELSLKPGDLLVCEGGEVGRAAILGEEPPADCIIQNALHRVRPRQADATGFLFYTFGMPQHKGGSTCSAIDRQSRTSLLIRKCALTISRLSRPNCIIQIRT